MLRSLRFTIVATALALAVVSTATAFAAPASWQRADITLHSEQSGGGIMLISAELPKTVALPAEAELSAPKGAEVQWVGQLLGGAASEDPELTYTKSTKGDVDVYRFTLTKSRLAQIEVPTTDALAFDGTKYNALLNWTTPQDIPEVQISVRVPQNAQITQQASGAALLPGPSGYKLYAKTLKNVKAGDAVNLAFAYSTPVAAPTTAGASSTTSSWAVPVTILLVVLAAGAALAVSVRRKLAFKSDRAGDAAGKAAGTTAARKATAGSSVRKTSQSRGARPATAEPETAGTGTRGSAKRTVVTAAIIGVLVAAALVVGSQTTKPESTGQTITKKFSQAEPCANVVVALALPSGVDSDATANRLFEALAAVKGLNTVTYNGQASNIDVGFCESQTNEAAVREALAPTGLVAEGAIAPSVVPTDTP